MSRRQGRNALAILSGGGTPPVMSALTSPYLSGAAGGQSVTLLGTNLSSVTGVTVGSANASGVSSTATSVTFTWPANAASATAYAVHVTTAGGTGSINGAVYYLPSSVAHAWYAAYGFTPGSPDTWVDIITGTSTNFGSGTQPTLNASWTNSQPAVQWGGAGYARIAPAFTSVAQPYALAVVADATNAGGFMDSHDTHFTLLYASAAGASLQGYTGVAITATSSLTSPFFGECFFSGSSSYVLFNGTKTTGTLGASNLANGVTIGDQETLGNPLNGHIGLAIVMVSNTTADDAILHGISQAIYGTP